MTEVEYLTKLCSLYEEQLRALVAQNHIRFSWLGKDIEELKAVTRKFRPNAAPSYEKRQHLKDALAQITRAVENILE